MKEHCYEDCNTCESGQPFAIDSENITFMEEWQEESVCSNESPKESCYGQTDGWRELNTERYWKNLDRVQLPKASSCVKVANKSRFKSKCKVKVRLED